MQIQVKNEPRYVPVVSTNVELPPLTEPPGTGVDTCLFQSFMFPPLGCGKLYGPRKNCIKRSETMPIKKHSPEKSLEKVVG